MTSPGTEPLTTVNLQEILKEHRLWLDTKGKKGERANLEGADLRWACLAMADLRWADLEGADLRWATLEGADLEGADLRRACLAMADLRRADLTDASLWGSDIQGALLLGAKRSDYVCPARPPLQVTGGDYPALVWPDRVEVGCSAWSADAFRTLDYGNRPAPLSQKSFKWGHAAICAMLDYAQAQAEKEEE